MEIKKIHRTQQGAERETAGRGRKGAPGGGWQDLRPPSPIRKRVGMEERPESSTRKVYVEHGQGGIGEDPLKKGQYRPVR